MPVPGPPLEPGPGSGAGLALELALVPGPLPDLALVAQLVTPFVLQLERFVVHVEAIPRDRPRYLVVEAAGAGHDPIW